MAARKHTRYRVMMTWVPKEDLTDLVTASQWQDALNNQSETEVGVCIWVTHKPKKQLDKSLLSRFCWHYLELPATVDRYIRGPVPSGLWSPWGNKSGPNFQFFHQMQQMALFHSEPWVLQLEGDTFLISENPKKSIDALIKENSTKWLLGGVNHPQTLLALPDNLHSHINGAALYRVGSQMFQEFLQSVWIPSLLEVIRLHPEMAYDCLTSPQLQRELPQALGKHWKKNRNMFIRSTGIINASSLSFENPQRPEPRDLHFETAQMAIQQEPWLFHAKIRKHRK